MCGLRNLGFKKLLSVMCKRNYQKKIRKQIIGSENKFERQKNNCKAIVDVVDNNHSEVIECLHSFVVRKYFYEVISTIFHPIMFLPAEGFTTIINNKTWSSVSNST